MQFERSMKLTNGNAHRKWYKSHNFIFVHVSMAFVYMISFRECLKPVECACWSIYSVLLISFVSILTLANTLKITYNLFVQWSSILKCLFNFESSSFWITLYIIIITSTNIVLHIGVKCQWKAKRSQCHVSLIKTFAQRTWRTSAVVCMVWGPALSSQRLSESNAVWSSSRVLKSSQRRWSEPIW